MPAVRLYALARAVSRRTVPALLVVGLASALVPASAQSASALQSTTLRIKGTTVFAPNTRARMDVQLLSGSTGLVGRTVKIYERPNTSTPWTLWRTVTTGTGGYAWVDFITSKTAQFGARFYADSRYAYSGSAEVWYYVGSLGSFLVQEASRHKGAPYQYGAAGPNAFDCSGFTLYVASRFGRSLQHSAAAQYNQTSHIARGGQTTGDLIFFYNSSGIYHVGFYAGSGRIWAANHPGGSVVLESIWTSSYVVGRLH